MTGRIVIDAVRPRTPTGRFPAKAVVGRPTKVSAEIFRDGHDPLEAKVRWRPSSKRTWREAPMTLVEPGLDRWEAVIEADTLGCHQFVIEAWRVPRDPSPQDGEDDPRVDLTRSETMELWVDRPLAAFGAWYEFFPRSEGGLQGATKRLSAVADMGFDIVYLPPIHPIGHTARKGPNNSLVSGPDDPGSPWAIGNELGGHTAIEPSLGTFDDFEDLVSEAGRLDLEIALDYALQCSPDHPWVTEHPEWFHHLPDGSIRPAENPPKRYEDIFPLNFWPEPESERQPMWEACKGILDFWIARGVKVYRVDNPHTKPIAFWEWLIAAVRKDHPDVIFLAEAFTRPRVMAKLAEVGFTQSYSYFTWRTTGAELREYVEEVCLGPSADFMRSNFWPNTPDIISGPLRDGPPAAFKSRLVLAATTVGSYGVYSGYELYENQGVSETSEDYLDSEKFQVRHRDWDDPSSLAPYMTSINDIRRRHGAFAATESVRFHGSSNDRILAYSKHTADYSDIVLMVVNLDVHHVQESMLDLDLTAIGLPADGPVEATDEVTGATWHWSGSHPYVRLDPVAEPAHVLSLRATQG